MKKYMLRKVYLTLFSLMFIGLLVFLNSNIGWAQGKSSYVLPKTIYWGCRYVGASLYTIPATVSEKITPTLGSKIRLIPGEDVDMINMLRAGKIHLSTFAADCYWASMGLGQYATFALGPQPMRIIWPGLPTAASGVGIVTKASGIKTPYDLKGKRMVRVVGAGHSEKAILAAIAFGNLTINDVTVYDVSSYGAGYKALAEGKADYCMGSITAPGVYELEASPYGVFIVRFPHEDREGWIRYRKYIPFDYPGWSSKGPGIKLGEKIPTPIFPWPIHNTLASQSNELVYSICRAIYAKMDEIVAAYEVNEAMKVDRAITPESTIMAPYHPGAVKFFKEIGVWTAAHEAANSKRLAHLEKLNKRWAVFVEESEEKMAKTGKKVDPAKEWPAIVEKEIGLLP